MSPDKKPLAIYVRVSSQGKRDDEELHSPELQEARIREWAAARGVPVSDEVFTDIDVSGSKMRRKGLDAALAGIKGEKDAHGKAIPSTQKYGGLIVARLTRFARSVTGGVKVEKQIRSYGGELVAIDFPVDTSTAAGRMMLRQMLGFFEYELDVLREQNTELRLTKIADEGRYFAGQAPAGYEWELLGVKDNGKPRRGGLIPNEHAAVVTSAFELRARGGSWAEVARLLTEAGVPCRSGKAWSYTGARSVIENRAYLGTARSGGVRKLDEETAEYFETPVIEKRNAHMALVSRALWEKANAQVGRAPTHGIHKGPILGGLIKCGCCGGAMSRDHTMRNGVLYANYKCKKPREHCPMRASMSARKVEALVVDGALERLGAISWEEMEYDEAPEAAELDALLADLDAEEAELEEAREAGDLTAAAYARALTSVERRRDDAERTRPVVGKGEAAVTFLSAGGTRDTFERMDVVDQRQILSTLVERVTVKPGRGSVEQRVVVEWAEFRPEMHGLRAAA